MLILNRKSGILFSKHREALKKIVIHIFVVNAAHALHFVYTIYDKLQFCNHFFSELITTQKRIYHVVTADSLYLFNKLIIVGEQIHVV